VANETNWLQKAVHGLRSFAYADEGRRPIIGLALGGGFARGIAHIGVLRAMEEHQIPIDVICGTSVGALIAATYASGTSLDEMERQSSETTFRDFGRWTLSRMGMATNDRLEHFLHKFTPAQNFSDMKIPLSIVATDIVTGESVYFTEGEIAPALRASCAYPGLFIPIEHQGRTLVDGFLTEAVPAVAAQKMGAELIISVHLEPGLLDAKPRNTIEVISRSFSIIQVGSMQAWRNATDVLIEPDVHRVLWDEFVKTPDLVAAGQLAANVAMPRIKDLLESLSEQATNRTGDGPHAPQRRRRSPNEA
jgi:NTE family protein